jgi:hypothetical protein
LLAFWRHLLDRAWNNLQGTTRLSEVAAKQTQYHDTKQVLKGSTAAKTSECLQNEIIPTIPVPYPMVDAYVYMR